MVPVRGALTRIAALRYEAAPCHAFAAPPAKTWLPSLD
jgi:hypothetical protein